MFLQLTRAEDNGKYESMFLRLNFEYQNGLLRGVFCQERRLEEKDIIFIVESRGNYGFFKFDWVIKYYILVLRYFLSVS